MATLRVIGAGRAGRSLAGALLDVGWSVDVMHHDRDLAGAADGCDLLVLAVPDHAVAATAERVRPVESTVVAHLAGALGLDVLAPHRRRASLHPMVPLPEGEIGARRLRGAWFAVAGDPLATEVAAALGGRVVEVPDGSRAAHHAAAAMASNHVVALLGSVERAAASAGVPLEAELGLVRAAVDDVAALGPERALTGPVARKDWATVDAHLHALGEQDRPAYLALAAEAARLAGYNLPAHLSPGRTAEAPASYLARPGEPGAAGDGRPAGTPPACANRPPSVVDTREGLAKTLDAARRGGRTVGLVPTMGALHEGHLSLIRRAAADCDVVAVTVFVNPLQFDRDDDLTAYPRSLDADIELAGSAGASLVFAPSVEEMYGPAGALATTVHVGGLADQLEGGSRPGHFDGVATVVTKLLSLAGPCRAYFGEKDFQQLAVVRRLVDDLSLPATVVGCPTVRADDGLALSSRNARLTADERTVAPLLFQALRAAAAAAGGDARTPAALAGLVVQHLAEEPRFRVDRVDVVDASTLEPLDPSHHPPPGTEVRILAAAFLGRVRLIDNVGVTL